MKQQLLTMLHMQDAMNSKVHEHWREQGFEWYRAIWVEGAELLDHYGWKWWKKQQPDVDQVKLELVDIWHFGLSILLTSGESEEKIADLLSQKFASEGQSGDFRQDIESFCETTLRTKGFDIEGFIVLLKGVEFSFTELYQQYVGKNVLNFFRQDHGYQDGSYIKIWNGKEDNEQLVEVIAELDSSKDDFKELVYQSLEKRYPS